jgi:hypothetical protein
MAAVSPNLYRRLEALRTFLDQAPTIAAQAFANGLAGQASPIVDDRFKGQGNWRFPALMPETVKAKARWAKGEIRKIGRNKIFFPGVGGTGSVMIGGQKPILVDSGALRAAVLSRRHAIRQAGETAVITFGGLPDYAVYQHTGTGRMPKRSPVEPDQNDRKMLVAILQKRLNAITRAAGQATGVRQRFGGGAPTVVV